MTFTPSNTRLTMLSRLRAGKPVFGTFLMLSSAWTARLVAQAGWDYVFVDCEHGNIGDNDMHDSVNAIAACGASPIVRVRGTDPTLIKRKLDTGAHGLMIPMVNTADQARRVVQASKFPPVGKRGQGSPFSAWALGLSTPEYLQQANNSLLTIVQIESTEGMDNVDEICGVPGVDAIFIGPNDLAMSLLNYAPARYDEPVFLRALDSITEAGRRQGKYVGILVSDGDAARNSAERYNIVAVGGDVKALSGWMSAQVKAARSKVDEVLSQAP
ncbi:hypothetical protein EHS25_007091 [Saitozyma podzolica]|uniref:HpcH/HpaI aldolase/citrate lyase domain-containing protein n=1 Tax=Saitozyma podzolica TaxID=1890683 RepID=A0A427XPJ9_9TREE|nr:hypothetical protein EHS25_007091 [Saitozyma podzolica]